MNISFVKCTLARKNILADVEFVIGHIVLNLSKQWGYFLLYFDQGGFNNIKIYNSNMLRFYLMSFILDHGIIKFSFLTST